MEKNGFKKRSLPEDKKNALHPIWEMVIKLSIYFLVSMWMFAMGLLVGRGTAPVRFDTHKLQQELAALKASVMKKEMKQLKSDTENLCKQPVLDFHEALKDTNDPGTIHIEMPPEKPKPEPEPPESELPEAKPPGPEVPIAEAPVREKSALTSKKDFIGNDIRETIDIPRSPIVDNKKKVWIEDSRPESLGQKSVSKPTETSSETAKNLTIQVASFRKIQDADDMVNRLAARGYPAYRFSGELPDSGTWHRVRIGHFSTRTDARSVMDKLKRENLIGILVNTDE